MVDSPYQLCRISSMKSISGCLIFEAHQLIDRPYWQMSPSYPKIRWVAIFASAYLQTKLIQNHTKKGRVRVSASWISYGFHDLIDVYVKCSEPVNEITNSLRRHVSETLTGNVCSKVLQVSTSESIQNPKTLGIWLGTPREPLIRWGHPTCIVVQITWKRGLKKSKEEKMRHRWIEWQFVTLLKPFSSHFPQSTSNVANSNKFWGPGLLLRPKWTLECQNQKAWRSSHISLHSKTRAAWRLCPEFHMWYSKAEITLKQAEINAKHIAYFISSWCRQPSHSKSDTVEFCDSFANSRYHVALAFPCRIQCHHQVPLSLNHHVPVGKSWMNWSVWQILTVC